MVLEVSNSRRRRTRFNNLNKEIMGTIDFCVAGFIFSYLCSLLFLMFEKLATGHLRAQRQLIFFQD